MAQKSLSWKESLFRAFCACVAVILVGGSIKLTKIALKAADRILAVPKEGNEAKLDIEDFGQVIPTPEPTATPVMPRYYMPTQTLHRQTVQPTPEPILEPTPTPNPKPGDNTDYGIVPPGPVASEAADPIPTDVISLWIVRLIFFGYFIFCVFYIFWPRR